MNDPIMRAAWDEVRAAGPLAFLADLAALLLMLVAGLGLTFLLAGLLP